MPDFDLPISTVFWPISYSLPSGRRSKTPRFYCFRRFAKLRRPRNYANVRALGQARHSCYCYDSDDSYDSFDSYLYCTHVRFGPDFFFVPFRESVRRGIRRKGNILGLRHHHLDTDPPPKAHTLWEVVTLTPPARISQFTCVIYDTPG